MMSTDATREQARRLWQQGYTLQMHGQLELAIGKYSESIAVWPTAEAYTFRGWARSFRGELEQAIEDCKQAIAVDPEFGNPYNDIGSYLIRMGQTEPAVEWLEKAKRAPRYEPRHYPYLNLGRLYMAQGLLGRALGEFQEALKIRPDEATAAQAVAVLKTSIN